MPASRKKPSKSPLEDAFAVLEVRARSEAEMILRLARKGHAPDAVAAAVARLKELKLLDDAALARHWVEGRRRTGQGRHRIRQDLRRRGLPRSAVEEALTESDASEDPDRETGRAWTSLTRRAKRLGNLDRQTLYRRLAGFLARRGFDPDDARHALERFFNRRNEEPPDD